MDLRLVAVLLQITVSQLIEPCFDEFCTPWRDADGEKIEAHGAGMLQSPLDHRWYWFGETNKTSNNNDHGVRCYSSTSLAGPWVNEGVVLRQHQISVKGYPGPYIMERPKVIYNSQTRKFVLWVHLDIERYVLHRVGVAEADSPAGPFKYLHDLIPDGHWSFDFTVWVDDLDQRAYFIRSCDNTPLWGFSAISGLTGDYHNTTGILSYFHGWWQFEAFALFRHPTPEGPVHMLASHTLSWHPNPLVLFRMDGPNFSKPLWANLGNPTQEWYSFNSQPTYIVPYTTRSNMTYHIYLADNWMHGGPGCLRDNLGACLIDASYVWLPFRISHGGILRLHKHLQWDMEDPFKDLPRERYPLRTSFVFFCTQCLSWHCCLLGLAATLIYGAGAGSVMKQFAIYSLILLAYLIAIYIFVDFRPAEPEPLEDLVLILAIALVLACGWILITCIEQCSRLSGPSVLGLRRAKSSGYFAIDSA